MKKPDAEMLSFNLLKAIKYHEDFSSLKQEIAELDLAILLHLTDEDAKKAFWINIYNAFFQILRQHEERNKKEIYRGQFITIAKQKFSLDNIEHGILRRFRYKYSMGYLPNIFEKNLIKRLALNKIDYRIHFALNCGAVSCPPITCYNSVEINTQLEQATKSFLALETQINQQEQKIYTTKLFLWFLADFGGKKGIRKILEKNLNLNLKGYKIIFSDYNWQEQLHNFV